VRNLSQTFPRRLVINSGAILAGEVLARLATFVMAVVVARHFGPVALGQYGFAVAIASILMLVPDLGLHLITVRELASDPARLRDIFWNVQWLKLLLAGGVATFTVILGELLAQDSGRRLLLYLLTGRIILQTFSQFYMSILKAFERMHYIAVLQFANATVVIIWVAAALILHAGLSAMVLALVVGQAAETWLGWRILRVTFPPGPAIKWNGRFLGGLLLVSAPVGITAILQTLNLRLDILVLGFYVPNQILGAFQAAAWFPVGAFLLASLLMTVLFPKLSRLLRNPSAIGSAYISGLLKFGMSYMTAGALAVWFFSPQLLKWFFGSDLASARDALRILAATIPLVFLNTVMFYIFVAAKQRRVYLSALSLGVTVGAGLNIMLASRYGVNGSAFADLLREGLTTVVYLFYLARGTFAQRAALALLRVFAGAALLAFSLVLSSGQFEIKAAWPVIWMLLLLGGALFAMGWPRRRELLLITDERL
jgi:O-antigen/teichoic acid export membrane protein